MSEVKNIPRLRFRNFDDIWSKTTLQSACEVNPRSNDLPNRFVYIDLESVEHGKLLFQNEISKDGSPSRAQRLLEKGDIIYQTVRPYQKNNYLFDLDGDYVASTGYAQLRTNQNSPFLYQLLHTEKFVNKVLLRSTGSNYPAINSTDLKKIIFNIPSIPEQQKIADFLTAVDKRIELLEKKKTLLETYKKGVMKKIFNQEIRFKDENGNDFPDWEEIKLGSLLKHVSLRNKSLNVELVLSVSNTLGFISQKEQFDKHRVASKDVSNYKIVCKNQFGYNPARINVGSIALLKDYEIGIVSPMYVIFQTKERLDSTYMEYLTKTHLFRHYVKVGCSGSVRDSLNFDEMEKFKFNIPSLNEQIKISNFLSSIDNQIELLDTQIDKSKTWKKGLLQKMFV